MNALNPRPAPARALPAQTGPAPLIPRVTLALSLLLILYASLRPFNWSPSRSPHPLDFLLHPQLAPAGAWDFVLNVLGYMPPGFLGVFAFRRERRHTFALIVTVIALAALSVSMETLQNFVPGRTPSPMDVTTNVAGALLGALIALLANDLLDWRGGFAALRERVFDPGLPGALGVVLLGAWLLALLAPRTLLYGMGDFRAFLGVPAGPLLADETYAGIEAAIAAANLGGLALLLRAVTRTRAPLLLLLLSTIITSLAVRTLGFGLFWTTRAAFAWLTDGAKLGLLIGVPLALAALAVPRRPARHAAAVAFALCAAGVNLAPPDPRNWMVARPTRQAELAPISAARRPTAAPRTATAPPWSAWPRRSGQARLDG